MPLLALVTILWSLLGVRPSASGPSPSAPVGRGVALARSVARAARMGTQAAHAHLHEIECVERLGLNSLMRALLS